MEICIEGLEVYAHHGVTAEERATGGRFVLDLTMFLGSCPAGETDDLAGTVDYGAVVARVTEVVQGRSFRLLERLATVVAEELLAGFPIDRVTVRVAKPHPPLDAVVGAAVVTLELTRRPG